MSMRNKLIREEILTRYSDTIEKVDSNYNNQVDYGTLVYVEDLTRKIKAGCLIGGTLAYR